MRFVKIETILRKIYCLQRRSYYYINMYVYEKSAFSDILQILKNGGEQVFIPAPVGGHPGYPGGNRLHRQPDRKAF